MCLTPYCVPGSLGFLCFCSLVCPATRSQLFLYTVGKLRQHKATKFPPRVKCPNLPPLPCPSLEALPGTIPPTSQMSAGDQIASCARL